MSETVAVKPADKALFNKSSRQKARVDVIVRTAARLIYERGVPGTSLDDVAEALGIAKPSLYYYVKGKEDLVYLCNRRIVDLKGDALDAAEAAGANGAEKLGLFTKSLVKIVMDPESGMPRLWQGADSILSGERREVIDSINAAHSKRVQKWFREGRRDGTLQVDDPDVAEAALLGSVYWIPISRRFTATNIDALADEYVAIFLNGFRPR